MTIEEIKVEIPKKFDWIDPIELEIHDGMLVFEEDYEPSEDEKNSDDCCDTARENGEMIIEKFPMLEIHNYYCHRFKYAIVVLKLKNT